ncbi:MAG TPA: hypothetical protein VG893_00900 [Terracidiphilus sp.]|nr:hypothetical protein [Terracidiphilus sp.]
MHSSGISIWFFIGILLTVYGALILGYGIYELATGHLAHVVLADLHAPVWWGAMMLALGLFYDVRFRPGRNG